ncbi:MAG: pseudouridine synthase [Bacilli bacterium]
MRLDRFLSIHGFGSRRTVKKFMRDMKVTVNGETVSVYDTEIKGTDVIEVNGQLIPNLAYVTILLNKPQDYMCSLVDERYPSVIRLIPEMYQKRVRIVGRLDADTTGLLLFTDNGLLNSRLANPRYEIPKTYDVEVNHILKPELVDIFKAGNLDIGRGEITSSSILEIKDENHASITVHEGKYHEIKRLFGKFNYDVIKLKRVKMGPLTLGDLKEGECHLLTEEEYNNLLDFVHLKREEQL